MQAVAIARCRIDAARGKAACLAALLALVLACADQVAAQAPGRVPTVTRLVQLFDDREVTLANALAQGNRAGVEALLADDFELRAGTAPGRPVPRAAWLAAMRTRPPAAAEPSGMAVHDVGNNHAIASFTLQEQGSAQRWFVVDVWRGAGSEWKLAIRYVTAASGPPPPGAEADTGELPKRY